MFRAYHGSNNRFDLSQLQSSESGTFGQGFYFVESMKEALCYGEKVIVADLIFQRPWLIDAQWDSPISDEHDFDCPFIPALLSLPSGASLLERAKSDPSNHFAHFDGALQQELVPLGFDSIVATYPDGSQEFVAFSKDQICKPVPSLSVDKSARVSF